MQFGISLVVRGNDANAGTFVRMAEVAEEQVAGDALGRGEFEETQHLQA